MTTAAALATIDGYATGNPWYYIECYRLAGQNGGVLDRWPDVATDDGAGVTIKHPGTGRAVTYTRKTDNRADGQQLRDAIEAVMLWRAEQVVKLSLGKNAHLIRAVNSCAKHCGKNYSMRPSAALGEQTISQNLGGRNLMRHTVRG